MSTLSPYRAENVAPTSSVTSLPMCPLCGAAASVRYQLQHTRVFECRDSECRLQFANPQLADGDLGRAYAELYYPREDGGPVILENATEFEVRRFLAAIAEHTGSLRGKKVLDYGCGNGVQLGVLAALGAEAVGIEQSETARERIANLGTGRAFADLESMQLAEPIMRFDHILLSDVVEHLREPWIELSKLRSLLSPNGRLFLTTPNTRSLRSRLSREKWDQRENLTHFYYFDSQSLSQVLRRAGFSEVTELKPITEYRKHGQLRRMLQSSLARVGLQGGLLFVAGCDGAPTGVGTK